MAEGLIRRLKHIAFGYRPKVGDVIRDRFNGKLKTVTDVMEDRVITAHFDGPHLRHGSLSTRNVEFVRS
ncbi:hypothetical protein ACWGM0_10645 [Sphingomonas bisphenolicum]